MLQITYTSTVVCISIIWCIIRVLCAVKNKKICLKRELQLLLVYVCIVVVARFTFFPLATVNGKTQPLIFDAANAFPPRINLIPTVNLLDYPDTNEILLNVIGNIAMFIPLGVIFPTVYKCLDTHKKAILAGVGISLFIEILQLPLFDRVTDIDDLLLNSAGYIIGYLLYLFIKLIKKKALRTNAKRDQNENSHQSG